MEDLKIKLLLFDKLTKDSKRNYSSYLTKKSFKKSDFFVKRGDISEHYYILTKGVARSYLLDNTGKEHTRTIFTPITTAGSLSSLILKTPSELAYECLTDCEFYIGDFNKFQSLSRKKLDFSIQYSSFLEKIALKMEIRVTDLSTLNATERYLKLQKEIPEIENLITQYHIASYLNISPVQLSRIRKEIIKKRLY